MVLIQEKLPIWTKLGMVFGLLLPTACIDIREIPLPDSPELLVVNALFSPDSTWKITVNQTTNSTTDDRFFLPYIDYATVELWEEDEYIGQLTYNGQGNYVSDAHPQIGVNYRLRVHAAGFDTVYATSYVPQYPADMEATWQADQIVEQADQLGGVFATSPLQIRFQDPIGEDNYFLFGTVAYDSCLCEVSRRNAPDTIFADQLYDRLKFRTLYANVSGATLDNDDRRLLISDKTFTDQVKQFDLTTLTRDQLLSGVSVYVPFLEGAERDTRNDSIRYVTRSLTRGKVFVEFYADTWSLSEDLHDYLAAYFVQGYQTADPFATYQNVATNVEGGLGIFAGYQRKLILLYKN